MKTCIKAVLFLALVCISRINAQSLLSLNTANYNSPDVTFHNPAAISFFENYHLMAGTQFLHTGLADESMQNSLLSLVYPFNEVSAIGARMHYFSSNIFQQGDFSLLYSQRFLNDLLTVGLNANLLTYGYDRNKFFLFDYNDPLLENGISHNAFSFGLSFLTKPIPNLLVGFSFDHLNSPTISISKDGFKKEKALNLGLAYLNPLLIPQLDMRIEGNDFATQATISKKVYNDNLNIKTGYVFYANEGSSFFAELDFLIGDLGVMYNLGNQLGDLSSVAGASHQIGLFYTKSEVASIPEIILNNIGYDSHQPVLEIEGKVCNKNGLDFIEIQNNEVVQEKIQCENNVIEKDLSQIVVLQPGENEVIVSAFVDDVSQRERILVKFEPLPPVIDIKSIQNTQVDDENYDFIVDVSDRVGLEKIEVEFNGDTLKSFSPQNKQLENMQLPVILNPGENKFKIVASNRWKQEDVTAFVVYKSAELPPVLTIDSPQKPVSPSSSIIINLDLENEKYIDEIIIKVNGEQTEIIKLQPKKRGVGGIAASIPVTYKTFATGSISRSIELKSTESIIEAIAYDSTGLPRTSSEVMKILYNPYADLVKYDRKIAIIVGIDNYQSEKISKLDLAVSDAETVKDLLKDHFKFDEIYTLYNSEATFNGIAREVYSKLKYAGPQDLIVFYYAGHGITIEDQMGGESGYLLPYDADLDADFNTLSMTNLNLKAVQSKAKDVLFIIDACYSGLGLVSVPPVSQYPSESIDFAKLNTDYSKFSRNIITAGGKKQEAVDGLFTRFLKNGLMGAADFNHDNYITSNELGFYLKSNVAKEARKYNIKQIPQFGSIISDQGDVVFNLNN